VDEIRIPPAGDPSAGFTPTRGDTIEPHYASIRRACGCYDGYHYLGHMVEGKDGDEVEVCKAVPSVQ
jgi:hypothetical protein